MEDLTLGCQRPTVFILRFGDLYLDGRVEALDSLDQMMQLKDLSDLKIKILFSVVVLAFKTAQQSVNELRGQLRHLLHLPTPPSASHRQNLQQVPHNGFTSSSPSTSYVVVEMEMHITSYLCKTVDTFDVSELIFDMSQQIYNTLYDYPCLRTCQGLLDYASQCVRLAWGLSVQRKPYTIVYDAVKYDTHFHTFDPNSYELAFKTAQQSVNELRGQLRHLLHLPTPPSASHRQNLQQVPHNGFTSSSPSTSYVVVEMEMHITSYLCKTVDTFDVSELIFDMSQQIYNTLYDYPCLRTCQGLLDYASQCVRLAWGLSVQRKPYTIVYDAVKYDTHFHTFDPNSYEIWRSCGLRL